MTPEFCGDKKVPRPTCNAATHPIGRVIGYYYEGWAVHRVCKRMIPENIPMGVYTHINFAFGSIDPVTFEAIPASAGDTDLWRRVISLKRLDPNLRIWLAIGGWTFNDDNQPTRTTFSDIVLSPQNSLTFIRSIIKLLVTYGFDGVDLDWYDAPLASSL